MVLDVCELRCVDLVESLERSFGVSISDADAARISTAGDLHGYLMAALPPAGRDRCLTAHAFYRLRRALSQTLHVDARKLTPSLPSEGMSLLGWRRRIWSRTAEISGLTLPELVLPRGLKAILASLCFLSLPAGLAWVSLRGWNHDLRALAALLPAGLTLGLASMMSSFAVLFRRDQGRLADLARTVLALNFATLSRETGTWRPEEVWDGIVTLLASHSDRPRETITPASHIVHDLGIC